MRKLVIKLLYGVMMLALPVATILHILKYDWNVVVVFLLIGLFAPVLIRSLTDTSGYTDNRGDRFLKQLFFAILGTGVVYVGWEQITTLMVLMVCYVASYSVMLLDRVTDVIMRKR